MASHSNFACLLRLPLIVVWLPLASAGFIDLQAAEPNEAGKLVVPFTSEIVHIDGRLDEPCYRATPLVGDADFVVAGRPNVQPPKTRAWLYWQDDRLIFAFDCEDADVVASEPSPHEHDVDGQDRVELFLWSGRPKDTYYCVEIAAHGARHDYSARFYRRFDDVWSPAGIEHFARRTQKGYCVEAAIPHAAIQKMGFRLEPGAAWRLGLFRADFAAKTGQGEPTWITWVDAKGPVPDFHVADSFGRCVLGASDK